MLAQPRGGSWPRRLRRRIALTLLACFMNLQAQSVDSEPRIDALLARMTLEEKAGQMSQSTSMRSPLSEEIKEQIRRGRWGSFLNAGSAADRAEAQRIATRESRLGIPLLFGRDVIHGYRTIFPIPLGQAASWNPELIRQAARAAAREAAADGIHWTFAPMIDITRDPRWGRIAESLGEDPYLTATLGAAMVRGFQEEGLAACAKHYAGYGAAEGGRDYNTTWIPERLLREVYLPPFQAAREAGVLTFMSGFNALNGIPATGNEFLLRRVLRGEWGFDGFVVSDYESVTEMVRHGVARDAAEAALRALRAGVDMEMVSTSFYDHLPALVRAGKADPKLLDEAVRRILRIKLRLGLFEPEAPPATASIQPLEVARRLSAQSVVLLKNRDGVLPLPKGIGKIAVIGPLADSPVDQMGTWVMDGRAEEVITPLAALRNLLGPDRVLWAPGLKNSRDGSRAGFPAAASAARSAEAVVLFLGEEQILSGEARSRAFLGLPGAQDALVEEVAAAGRPVIAVILAGRPLTFSSVASRARAVLYAWHPGTMGGPALADLLFGNAVPSGKLAVSFPRTAGQVPVYYSHLHTGRPPAPDESGIPTGTPVEPKGFTSKYLDVDVTPEYPFGFGLSYTTFEYSNLRLSAAGVPRGAAITVSADIANTGRLEAEEVVQLYVRDPVASVARPVRELKGFERIRLKPGEKRTLRFSLSTGQLAFYDERMQRVTEPGLFQVWVAPDSVRGVAGSFTVR